MQDLWSTGRRAGVALLLKFGVIMSFAESPATAAAGYRADAESYAQLVKPAL
jgi:hypothetical protein